MSAEMMRAAALAVYRRASDECRSAADRRWQYDFAAELDAIPPDTLRALVQAVLTQHMPDERLKTLLAAEESERQLLHMFAKEAA